MMKGLILIKPRIYTDRRGYFFELYQKETMERQGVNVEFVQDNLSYSIKNTIRGMHFQVGQGKLVTCLSGSIFDVVVDIRPHSKTFGKWESFELNQENHHQLFLPEGFAHGFCCVSDHALVMYKITTFFNPSLEKNFAYNDKDVGIDWPCKEKVILSDRDTLAPSFKEVI